MKSKTIFPSVLLTVLVLSLTACNKPEQADVVNQHKTLKTQTKFSLNISIACLTAMCARALTTSRNSGMILVT